MKKLIGIALAVVLVMTLGVGTVFAGVGKDIKDIDGDHGKHYQINIIGVKYGKTVNMENSNRHTIFVPLDEDGNVEPVEIKMMRNPDDPNQFRVADGNAMDDDGALIYMPYEDFGDLCYNIYAVALGKPMKNGMEAHVKARVEVTDGFDLVLLEDEFKLRRDKGKPTVKDISKLFRLSGWVDVDASGGYDPAIDYKFTNVWPFNVPALTGYFWDYDANSLKLMQVRFYENEGCGSFEGKTS